MADDRIMGRDRRTADADDTLCKWARQYVKRDEMVRAAAEAGVSIRRIQEVTGIARTTIDRILASPAKPPRQVPLSYKQVARHIASMFR